QMTTSPRSDGFVVAGVEPWLPWPLCAWTWWTRPVPAERLALLRIGLSFCLLIDLWFNYRPHLLEYFGAGSLGDPDLFAWYAKAPRWNWSLLRGLGDPLLSTLVFIGWMLATVWLGLELLVSLTGDGAVAWKARSIKPILSWNVTSVLFVLSIWSRY